MEAAILAAVARPQWSILLIDLGTGTGRMLELLAALLSPRHRHRCEPRDDRGGARPARCVPASATRRCGSAISPTSTAARSGADLIIIHQVLHYFDDPGRVLLQARRALKPGGEHADRRFRAARARIPARPPRASPPRASARRRCRAGRALPTSVSRSQEAFHPPTPPKASQSASGASPTNRIAPDERPTIPIAPSRTSPATRGPPFHVSFEFFPPKTDVMEERFWESITQAAPLHPRFVSVTYGAGGSTRERTLRMVKEVKVADRRGRRGPSHLRVGAARRGRRRGARLQGSRYLAASSRVRGDPPEGVGKPFIAASRGLQEWRPSSSPASARSAISISRWPPIRRSTRRRPSWDADIDNLKRKLDAGATRAITQMFFDNDDYFRLVDRARKAGITAPIVPGIQPIHSFKQISGFASRCGASIPGWVAERFEGLDEDPETHALVASAVAAEQVLELVDNGHNRVPFLYAQPLQLRAWRWRGSSATGRIDPGTVQRALRSVQVTFTLGASRWLQHGH